MTIWNEIMTKPGKYPDKAFSAKLESMYIAQTEKKGIPYLQIKFQTGEQVGIYGFDQLEQDNIKHVSVTDNFKAAGQLIESLGKLHVKCYVAYNDQGIPEGFKTEPDLTGCTLFMRPIESKNKKDDGTPWISWVVDKIEYSLKSDGSQTTEQTKPQATPAPASAPAPANTELDDKVLEASEKAKNYREIWLALGKAYKISEIGESIQRLISAGYIPNTWGK